MFSYLSSGKKFSFTCGLHANAAYVPIAVISFPFSIYINIDTISFSTWFSWTPVCRCHWPAFNVSEVVISLEANKNNKNFIKIIKIVEDIFTQTSSISLSDDQTSHDLSPLWLRGQSFVNMVLPQH